MLSAAHDIKLYDYPNNAYNASLVIIFHLIVSDPKLSRILFNWSNFSLYDCSIWFIFYWNFCSICFIL